MSKFANNMRKAFVTLEQECLKLEREHSLMKEALEQIEVDDRGSEWMSARAAHALSSLTDQTT
jgi:hypothetical protein